MTARQRMPASLAARRTACAWLPPELRTTPSVPAGSRKTAFVAPRNLKLPVRCRHSGLSQISRPQASSSASMCSTGVRQTRPSTRVGAPAGAGPAAKAEVPFEEARDLGVAVEPVREPGDAVSLILVAKIGDLAPALAQRLHHLLGLADRHPRVVGAVHDQQRAADAVDLVDGRD